MIRLGERHDRWPSLFDAAEKASALEDGLFGASRAGSPGSLGRLEALIVGEEEDAEPSAAREPA